MAIDRRPEHARNGRVPDPIPPGPSNHDAVAPSRIATRPTVSSEISSMVLCGPAAVVVPVLVARHGWPVWWLVIAGMLLAWAGDAAWNLIAAAVDGAVARRTAARHGGEHR